MPMLNPFLYGNPVPPSRHVGRQAAVHTLFARLHNGESTVLMGEPHIGKSSLLRYVADEGVRVQWLGEAASRYVFTEIDCQMLSHDFTPADFWRQALATLPQAVPDEAVVRQWHVVADNLFGSFTLENLFRLLARSGRRVVLIIDEFDALLNHPNFNVEFFGALRSIATRTDGLAVVVASRLSVTTMNRLTQERNPYGSPFFNNHTEIRLRPFSLDESRSLLETTLAATGVAFTQDDHAYIHGLASRHPFLLQVAAAGLFDAVVAGQAGETRYQATSTFFHDGAAAHFDDVWRQYLSPAEQTALIILTLGEMKGRVDSRAFDTNDLGRLEWYGLELGRLQEWGWSSRLSGAALSLG